MNYDKLFAFIITHVQQLDNKGHGVAIVRVTPLEEITKKFDDFLNTKEIKKLVQYKKEINPKFPDIVCIVKTIAKSIYCSVRTSKDGKVTMD